MRILVFIFFLTSVVCANAQAIVLDASERPLAHDDQEINNNYNAIKALEQDIQDLRYQLEQQAHELEKIKNSKFENINTKLERDSTRANDLSESEFYQQAFQYIKEDKTNEGLQAMNEFIAKYPNSGFIPNAHYWIGEIEMNQKNYNSALTEFQWIIDNTPKASKASFAMLKKGYIYEVQGDLEKARQTLQYVMRSYPNTEVAHLAATKLKSL